MTYYIYEMNEDTNSTIKKQRSLSMLFSPNLTKKPMIQPNNAVHLRQHQTSHSTISKAFQCINFSCCQQNVIKNLNAFKTSKQTLIDLYIMPCGHNICQQCISTRLKYNRTGSISCSNSQCTSTYSLQDAEQFFIKNKTYLKFILKLINLHFKICSVKTRRSQQRNIAQTKKKNTFHLRTQAEKKERLQIQMPQSIPNEKSSGGSNEQQIYNPCINIFCKKPTLSLFCSEKCQELQIKLQQ